MKKLKDFGRLALLIFLMLLVFVVAIILSPLIVLVLYCLLLYLLIFGGRIFDSFTDLFTKAKHKALND